MRTLMVEDSETSGVPSKPRLFPLQGDELPHLLPVSHPLSLSATARAFTNAHIDGLPPQHVERPLTLLPLAILCRCHVLLSLSLSTALSPSFHLHLVHDERTAKPPASRPSGKQAIHSTSRPLLAKIRSHSRRVSFLSYPSFRLPFSTQRHTYSPQVNDAAHLHHLQGEPISFLCYIIVIYISQECVKPDHHHALLPLRP